MSEWIVWLVVAGILVVMELFSGTFYLLMIAAGLCAGALAAWLGWPGVVQVIVAAVVGSAAIFYLRSRRIGTQDQVAASRDPNVNLDIGQSLQVTKWSDSGNGTFSSRAAHRGAHWDVLCISPVEPQAGRFVIIEIQGSQLIVEPAVA